jgi:hypothetical protein
MANSDKNIVITPSVSSTTQDPRIVFSGADTATGPQNVSITVYPLNDGTLSFDASKGQLLSIDNTFDGAIFSVNDISGIPNIEVFNTGVVRLVEYNGRVVVGAGTDNESSIMQVFGDIPSLNQNTGSLVVRGGVGITGDINAAAIYSNGILVNPSGGVSAEEAIAYSVVFGG